MLVDRRTVLTAALFGVAAVAGANVPGSAQTAQTLKIATTPTDIGSEVFYAQDKGFFKANGLDAQIQVISNGAAITSAVMSGALDVAQSNIASLAAAHERGLDVVIIAPAGQYSSKVPTTALVVAKNSPIKTAKDLNGKTLAGNGIKNITQVGAFAWMEKNGGDTSTTKFVEMPFPDMPGALVAGRIDAAVIAEPELSAALAKGDVRVLGNCYDGIAKEFMIGAWFTTGDYAKAHPDIVRKFAAVMAETASWMNDNPGLSATIVQRNTKITFSERTHRMLQGGKLNAQSLQPLIDSAARYGVLEKSFPAVQMVAPQLPASAR